MIVPQCQIGGRHGGYRLMAGLGPKSDYPKSPEVSRQGRRCFVGKAVSAEFVAEEQAIKFAIAVSGADAEASTMPQKTAPSTPPAPTTPKRKTKRSMCEQGTPDPVKR